MDTSLGMNQSAPSLVWCLKFGNAKYNLITYYSLFGEHPDLFEVGGFYEIDHQQLPPKSPIHLKDIRVVMVSERTRLNVTVSFPSAFSLRKYFAEVNPPVGSTAPTPLVLPQPELDEQFVMGFNHAGRILRRLIPSSEVEEEVHLERFWLVAPKAQESEAMQLTAEAQEEDKEEDEAKVPASSCLLALKNAGLVEWGVRRKVKYIGRHREEIPTLVTAVKEEGPMEGCGHVGRKRVREVGRNRKKKKDDRRFKKLKRVNGDGASDRKVFKATKDRWSSERYEAAELKLLEIMKLKGAVLGNPILRPELREEARNYIGDTGLLDHLLKHMAGKVVSEGSERFRRRHNPEGAMEYWLEPAELQDMRRSAGVMDPFWLPPSGWNPGDPITPYGAVSGKEIEYLKEELASLRRDIEWLRSLKLQEEEAQDAQSRADAASILKMQESYESLSKCNAKLEEQVAAMATCLQVMKEEMRLLKLDKEKREAMDRETEAKSGEVVGSDGRDDEKTSDETRTTARSTRANGITNSSSNTNSNNKSTESSSDGRTVRRSGFRICKPQGTFLWPNMGSGAGICSTTAPHPSSASGGYGSSMMSSPNVAVPAEDPCGVPPTPHSASSATSPPRRVSPVAAPRAQVVVVVAHHQQQQQERLVSSERTDSSDKTCASLQTHTRVRPLIENTAPA
ncbi:hypothetical protein Taro_025370 [Colocasia esculenta]|uniref:PTC1-like winged helix-turn-helix domain-containing protein n=1 Tax=Colocasia esculenta TaxID=4460 RepID=A0A843V342_COLES|nr:hypothetical protein [Colocasia esculenta]